MTQLHRLPLQHLQVTDRIEYPIVYHIDGEFFDARDLTVMHAELLPPETEHMIIPNYEIPADSYRPIFVYNSIDSWNIGYVNFDGVFQLVTENPRATKYRYITLLQIPQQYQEEELFPWNLPDPSGDLVSYLHNFTLVLPVEPHIAAYPPLHELAIEMFFRQLYSLETIECPKYLVVHGLERKFISYEEAYKLFKNKRIIRFEIEPLLQPWAGLPGTQNRIITLYNKNGLIYLVKARHNSETNGLDFPLD